MNDKQQNKMRESLKLLRSPFYRNSKREKQEKLEQFNDALHELEKVKAKHV